MIIGVNGIGYTGSGAVTDLLSEFDCIEIQDEREMSIAYRPDGLDDLAYSLENPSRFFRSDIAFERFRRRIHSFYRPSLKRRIKNLICFSSGCEYDKIYEVTDEYIDSITQVKWEGFWPGDADYLRTKTSLYIFFILDRLFSKHPQLWKKIKRKFYYRTMRLSVSPDEFYERTREYTTRLFEVMGYDTKKMLVSDQLFAGDAPARYFKYYESPKAIVVDKDPRDLYVFAKVEMKKDEISWTPTDNVYDFIKYYDLQRKHYKKMEDKDVLLVKFEDLIYNYETSVDRIVSFLGISRKNHVEVRKHFEPQVSINNTQLYKKHTEFAADIAIIEKELSYYLFPFEKYPEFKHTGETF